MERKRVPSNPDNWLYQEQENKKRIFRNLIYLGITANEWLECTNEEKLKWETENPTLVEGYEEPETQEEEQQ